MVDTNPFSRSNPKHPPTYKRAPPTTHYPFAKYFEEPLRFAVCGPTPDSAQPPGDVLGAHEQGCVPARSLCLRVSAYAKAHMLPRGLHARASLPRVSPENSG